MNSTNVPEPDLDNLLESTLRDDLPPEAEAGMSRQFLRFRRTLETAQPPESFGWTWMRGALRKEMLALASAALITLGLVMQLGGSQTVLAYTIEQLKVIVTISSGLNRVSFMDCTVMKRDGAGEQGSQRVRWRASGDARLDREAAGRAQTLWISNEAIAAMTPGPVWQPGLEFISPKILAKNMEQRYGLMQNAGKAATTRDEFLITGSEGRQDIEIIVDAKTYLPKVLRKYWHDPGRANGRRNCVLEARFLWNGPIASELFKPVTDSAEPK